MICAERVGVGVFEIFVNKFMNSVSVEYED